MTKTVVFIFQTIQTLVIGLALAASAHWLLGEEYASRQQAKILAPIEGYFYGTTHRDDITVLLIDDASLNKIGITWPAPYAYEARLLRAVGRYQPKSVFLDIFFKDNRKAADIGQLVQEICALKAQGIEVYLGATKNDAGQFTLRDELEATSGKCFKKTALYFLPDSVDRTAWSYPISPFGQSGAALAINPAAVEMYNDLTKTTLVPKGAESSLALTWGSVEAKQGIPWTEQIDGEAPSERYCRGFQGMREMIPGALRQYGLRHYEKPICVFHETLLAQDLSTNSAAEEAIVARRIKGKSVMVGVALTQSQDHVLTPLHGRIPGVYLHAMALDNLLVYGADYPEETSLHFDKARSHLMLLAFLMTSIVLIGLLKSSTESLRHRMNKRMEVSARRYIRNATRSKSGLHRWLILAIAQILYIGAIILKKIGVILLITFATGGIALFGASVFHIGFISTFSIAMFVVAAEWLEIKEKLVKQFVLKPPINRPTSF